MATGPTTNQPRERLGIFLLIVLGVGTRLAFLRAYPTLPFWDSLQLIHFGQLIRDHGLTAAGWYWGQFNPGVPMALALLFKTGVDPYPFARLATAALTGLLGLLPFLIWRRVLAFRWRLLAGALLALWPGQVFFSGVVAQDNWVLLPTLALACLAVRRLRGAERRGHAFAAALLYAAAFSIRQEMLVVLLPLALTAATSPRAGGRRRRDLAALALVSASALLLLAVQRHQATRRFTITTEHGALGLFGTFMPGSSAAGWIDARAYAAALDPSIQPGLFGSQTQLIRLTWQEIKRRPGFHLLRVASWLPRLALDADSDNLFWSVGSPRAMPEGRQAAAGRLATFWRPLLKAELAVIQGLFVASLIVGFRGHDSGILILASAVALKFLVHIIVSPLGRLVVPAVALELLVIPLGAAALESHSVRARLSAMVIAGVSSLALFFGTPPLSAAVIALDSSALPGVHEFFLRSDGDCVIRCELRQGGLTGLTPTTAWLDTGNAPMARVNCYPPTLGSDDTLALRLKSASSGATVRIEADRAPLASNQMDGYQEFPLAAPGVQAPRAVSVTLWPGTIGVKVSVALQFTRITEARRP